MYLQIDQAAGGEENRVEGRLTSALPAREQQVTYPTSGKPKPGQGWSPLLALGGTPGPRTGASFETAPMAGDTEVTGPVVLVVWVSSTSKDMDIFATVRNIGPDGKDVWEVGPNHQPVPVTKGWLRASHRKLDPERSLPYRPYHAHDERLWLKAGEVVECRVEIWPTCMVFRKGHRLRLDIQPRDGVGSAPHTHYHADYNAGARNSVHAGGRYPSHLLLPIIPSSSTQRAP
jgi:hypothetical protein